MKQRFIYGAMACGLLLAGCSADDIPVGPGSVAEADQTFYVALNLRGDMTGATRAGAVNGSPEAGTATDFDGGTEQESAVNNAYFVFYDDKGDVVGNIVSVDLGTYKPTPTDPADPTSVGGAYKSIVPVSVRKGEQIPTKVICYINPISPASLQTNLATIQTVSRPAISTTVNSQTYLAMSNSVYYPVDENGAVKGEPQIAVPLPEGTVQMTYEDAKTASEANDATKVIDIYVERYASKLSFESVAPSEYKTATRIYNADGTTTVNDVVLTFVPQYWAVNGQSKESYVIKSFRKESDGGHPLPDNYTYDVLNGVINSNGLVDSNKAWTWNNPTYKRSYWGMSPAYFQNEYPEVESDLEAMQPMQDYIAYSELPQKGFQAVPDADGKVSSDAKYFKETTVGSKALGSDNPAAAVASVIYVGQYKLKVNDTEIPAVNGKLPGFYTYLSGQIDLGNDKTEERPYVYFETKGSGSESAIAGGESMLKRFFAQTTVLYKKENDGSFTRYDISNSADLQILEKSLEVAAITPEVKKCAGDITSDAEFKLPDNVRSLQFISVEAANNNGIYIASGNGYKQLVMDDATVGTNQIKISEANAVLMQQVGYAHYYNMGMAFFNIPVKHYGWYRTGNEQRDAAKIDWSKVRVGDFGMVRNHRYDISVSEITGLAKGIAGPDVPIIPTSESEDLYVAYTVRILKWAWVPKQNVKL